MGKMAIRLIVAALTVACMAQVWAQEPRNTSAQENPLDLPAIDQVKVEAKKPSSEKATDESDTAKLKKRLAAKLKEIYGSEISFEISDIKALTEPNDSASGVKVDQDEFIITIDPTPCSKKKSLITFHKEYSKEDVDDVDCDGKKYKRIQVTQR